MQLHLLLGSVTNDHTRHAATLAREWQAPVLVLDRIQAYTDLTVGSGRRYSGDTDVRHWYLAERTVPQGNFAPALAFASCIERLATARARRHLHVVALGSSITLVQRLLAAQLPFPVHVRYVPIGDQAAAKTRLARQVARRLAGGMLSEPHDGWCGGRRAQQFLATVPGFDALIATARAAHVPPTLLARAAQQDAGVCVLLGVRVVEALLSHATPPSGICTTHATASRPYSVTVARPSCGRVKWRSAEERKSTFPRTLHRSRTARNKDRTGARTDVRIGSEQHENV